jgi:hypothetical protein
MGSVTSTAKQQMYMVPVSKELDCVGRANKEI